MRLPGVSYDSPLKLSLKQRIVLATVPRIAAFVLKLLIFTTRKHVINGERFAAAMAAGPFILAIWHESLGLGVSQHAGSNFHTIASYSYDGELATRAIRQFGIEAVRGSSSQGGSNALTELGKVLAQGTTVGWTLDGPRGPRRVAKAGVGVLAARSQAPVLPMALTVDRAWRLRSWDRFPIPKPFSHIICAYAEPVPPPASDDPEAVEAARSAIESSLNELHQQIELELGVIQTAGELPA